MNKNQEPLISRDCSRGTIRMVQNSIIPQNCLDLAINMVTDERLGSGILRKGSEKIGYQAISGSRCYGLHNYRDDIAASHKLFGVFSTGTENKIYDMISGVVSLSGDTANAKTRFCTFLGATVRVNGIDAAKSYDGSSWVSSGGAFDEANMPLGNVVIEWKDRVYTAIGSVLYYSGIADSNTRTVSWTYADSENPLSSEFGYIGMEQEDGGGDIVAFAKVPGYLLVFKERALKRWDGATTYPEDLINIGTFSQESVCQTRGMAFFVNQSGLWATNGGYPKRISGAIQDIFDAIPASSYQNIACYSDENSVYVSLGTVTVNGITISNAVVKYNIEKDSFDIFSYPFQSVVFASYINSGFQNIVCGDTDGNAIQVNTGYSDYGNPIAWKVYTYDIDFGDRLSAKTIDRIGVFIENGSGSVSIRSDSRNESDFISLGALRSGSNDINGFSKMGNYFTLCFSGMSDIQRTEFLGFMFPIESISFSKNLYAQ